MNTPMSDQVVVVTGASAGVGRAIARAFARRGARLGLIARNADTLAIVAEEVRQLGGDAMVCPLDVSDPEAVEAAAAALTQCWGHIDTWVNNAMVTVLAPARQMTAEEFQRVTAVNYLGYVYGTLAALRRMTPRDQGNIIQIGSALAYRAIPLQSAYCASKLAIRGFTDSLRSELLHDGSHVRLSMVQLPAVNTPQFEWARSRMPRRPQPVPPIYSPALIAEAVVWTAEHMPRELTIATSALKAIIGQKLIPGLLDHYLARTGYDAQQTDQPSRSDRPDNLFQPVVGDYGADGPFAEQASSQSLELWLRMHRRSLLVAGGAAVAGLGTIWALGAARSN